MEIGTNRLKWKEFFYKIELVSLILVGLDFEFIRCVKNFKIQDILKHLESWLLKEQEKKCKWKRSRFNEHIICIYILLKVFNIPSTWLVFSEGYTYFKNFSKEYIEKKIISHISMVLSELSNYKSIDNTHFYIDRIHKM